MDEPETVRAAIETAASNPKIAMGVAATTTYLGAASMMEVIQGALSVVSLVIGCLVGLFVIRIHMVKYKLLMRAWESGETVKGE